MAIIPFARLPHSVMCAPCAPATLISLAVIRIDKELSISNSTNIGEVSGGGQYAAGVIGRLDNAVNSAGTKSYSHNTSFSATSCSNRGSIDSTGNSSGIIGYTINRLSYAGITFQDIANTILNAIIIKYCFNIGNISGADGKGGISGHIYCYVGTSGYNDPTSETKPIRGGKSYINVTYNWNAGSVSNTTNANSIAGILSHLYNFIYSNSCYSDVAISNNCNTGSINGVGSVVKVAGIVAWIDVSDSTNKEIAPNNINIEIANNYNYCTGINGGDLNLCGGMNAQFEKNCSRVFLLNNYSAYKRTADNNVHGTNPAAPNGANVGEEFLILNT